MTVPAKPTFKEALAFWFKLGWISFGGPAGQIAIMHSYLVDKKRWISDRKFLHALNYCMLLPGPEAQQLATYTGWLLHGTRGGLAAGILFVLPSACILLILSLLYVTVGDIPWVQSLFTGLKPAVVSIVLLAMIKIGKRSLTDWMHYLLAIGSFIAIFFFKISFIWILAASFAIAFISIYLNKKRKNTGNHAAKDTRTEEEGYFLTTSTPLPHTRFQVSKLLRQIGIFSALWLIPYLFAISGAYASFWHDLITFFTQAAFVTFGGAYAVLPYVAQEAVYHYEWLNSMHMIDGLALGETTPGPLIMVLAFVGFMGGYTTGGNSLLMGTLGLFTTTYYTFLPCFLFIFAGGPLIERTQDNPHVKQALTFVTAAITGVILNLTVYFAEAVLFGKHHQQFAEIEIQTLNIPALIWIGVSIIALHKYKVSMPLWIGISAAMGLMMWIVG